MRRRILILLGVVSVALLGAYTAHAQGALLYRDADLRLAASLDPEGLSEVEQVWRFQVPPGARQIEIRKHSSNEGEAALAFGAGPGKMHSVISHTPSPWKAPDLLEGSRWSRTAVEPGPYEIRVSAKAPARFVIGVYFLEEPYRAG